MHTIFKDSFKEHSNKVFLQLFQRIKCYPCPLDSMLN